MRILIWARLFRRFPIVMEGCSDVMEATAAMTSSSSSLSMVSLVHPNHTDTPPGGVGQRP